MWCICFIILLCLSATHGFYIPGVAPVEFKKGETVDVKAVKMTSIVTQLPYEYYSLPFCQPDGGVSYSVQNLGEVLRGDRIVNTPFIVNMAEDRKCTKSCTATLTAAQAKTVKERIEQKYSVHLLVDNLPAATKFLADTNNPHYEHGFRLGFTKNSKAYLNNHWKLVLKYHTDDNGATYRVVGFEVEPMSVKRESMVIEKSGLCSVEGKTTVDPQEITGSGDEQIHFTYDVKWEASDIRWASRWDTYLSMTDVQIHWFSIINSIVIIFFLSGVLTMIMIRTLRKDIAKYNSEDDMDDTLEETGWKLVHGDVFRSPRHPKLLCAMIGSGVQIFCMIFVTIFFAMLGMLSPASRGSLMTAAIFIYVFMGLISGYFSARLYKTMRGAQWKSAALWTATLFPSIVLGMGLFLDFFIWGEKSSGAVPFGTMVALLCMWFGISLPLNFIGYYFGYRKHPYEHPVRTNQIPRAVPEQKWYHNMFVSVLLAGVLPFGAVFIEMFFVFTAIWERQFYYLFGFLFIVFIILIISCSQISIVMVYFQLCGENYHWWWRSFIISGGSAIYVFGYTIFYYSVKLEITGFIPTLLYFGYSFIMVLTFAVLTGTIGFYAAYWFIRKIYGAIKID